MHALADARVAPDATLRRLRHRLGLQRQPPRPTVHAARNVRRTEVEHGLIDSNNTCVSWSGVSLLRGREHPTLHSEVVSSSLQLCWPTAQSVSQDAAWTSQRREAQHFPQSPAHALYRSRIPGVVYFL